MSEEKSIEDDITFLKAILAVNDTDYELWTQEQVEHWRKVYLNRVGFIPTIEQAMNNMGNDRAAQLIPAIIEWKKFDNILKGKHDPCHFCGGKNKLQKWRFGLASPKSAKYSLTEATVTVASLAISALTLPLLGQALVSLPGQTSNGFILKMVICKECRTKNANFLGIFMPKEKYKIYHPLYDKLHKAGYTKYIPSEKLEMEFISEL